MELRCECCVYVHYPSDTTVVPAKSDSDVIFCLQLLSKTLACTLHLSYAMRINPKLWIGLIRK